MSDKASKANKPDFDSGKGWAWEKMTKEAKQAGTLDKFPRKPRKGLQEHSFWDQVDRHMSRTYHQVEISFDKDGKRVE